MTSKSPRSQRQRLIESLHKRVGTFDIDLVLQLLDVCREEVKEKLLRCSPEEFPRLQGEGVAYDNLVKAISRKPLSQPVTE